MPKKITLYLLLLIGVADIYLIKSGQHSISNVILLASKDWAIIPFMFGMLAGHLFWANKPDEKEKNNENI